MKQAEVVDELNRAREIEVRPSALTQSLEAGDRDGGKARLGFGEFPAIRTTLLQTIDAEIRCLEVRILARICRRPVPTVIAEPDFIQTRRAEGVNLLNGNILVEVVRLGLEHWNGADNRTRVVLNNVVPGKLVSV